MLIPLQDIPPVRFQGSEDSAFFRRRSFREGAPRGSPGTAAKFPERRRIAEFRSRLYSIDCINYIKMKEEAMDVSGFDHLNLTVRDLAQSTAWYGRIFRF